MIVRAFTVIDGWLDLPWPGAGFAATLLIILLVGFLASNLLTSQLIGWLEE
ncbi:MAG: hypothetical protein HY275_18110, partial [Gemmatimonadetes bacterium]|nr:hypothetical protein [Gemmatimonadota bacterium]